MSIQKAMQAMEKGISIRHGQPEPVIDTCDHGHMYAKLPDHPRDNAGNSRCPHCMSIGLDLARKEIAELRQQVENKD